MHFIDSEAPDEERLNAIKALIETLSGGYVDGWLKLISERAGHNLPSLIQNDEKTLMGLNLITPRNGNVGIFASNVRLSDLGLKLCEKLQKYAQEIININSD